jgi:hypothetical protein
VLVLKKGARMIAAVFLTDDEPELCRAWQTFVDPVMADVSGEVLEYMETTQRTTGVWIHVFRHRCHPETHERTYWQVPAAAGWVPRL